MKSGIENKILIPFLILVILPVIVVGITSYSGSYQLILENKKTEMQRDIDYIRQTFRLIDNDVENGIVSLAEGKERAMDYLNNINGDSIIIINKETNVIFNNSDTKLDEPIIKIITEKLSGEIEFDNTLILFSSFVKWDWTVVSIANLDYLAKPLIEIQKYTLLVAIIAAIIAVELTILIAHNISRPIKKLAELCKTVSVDNFEKIVFNRKDEIGVLADSFYNMMIKLKKNTDELIKIKKYNEDILRSTTTGIITINNEMEVISVNRTAKRLITSNLHKELMKDLKDTLNNKEAIQNKVKSFLDNKNQISYIEINTSILKNEKNEITGALCSFNDITKRKEIENKIIKIDRLTSLGEMAAGLAHEIRNPLTGIKTSTQVLSRRLGRDIKDNKLFKNIISEIDRMNRLVTEMLELSNPSLSKLEIKNINNTIKESVYLLDEKLKSHDIKIDINFSKMVHMVEIDESQIKQILLNILINSINAISDNGEIKIITSESKGLLTIEIEDNGKGIKKDHINKIFDPFFTTDPAGTGLGLSVVHKLVEQNNGEIEVSSQLDKGTSFFIRLPLGSDEYKERERDVSIEKKNINNR